MGRDFAQERRELRAKQRGGYTLTDLEHQRRVEEQRARLAQQREDQARKNATLGVSLFGEVGHG